MGRAAVAAGLQRYQNEGAWGASPHLPPHRSLHSPSGTISQLFKIHGPNYGVCGGPGCATEILAAAAAHDRRPPRARRLGGPDGPRPRPAAGSHAGALAPGTHLRGPGPGADAAAGLDRLRDSPARRRRRGSRAAGRRANRPPPSTCSPCKACWTPWPRRRMSAAPASCCRWRRAAAWKSSGSAASPNTRTRTATAPALDARLLSPFPLAEAKR